jgi:hypothetical protein
MSSTTIVPRPISITAGGCETLSWLAEHRRLALDDDIMADAAAGETPAERRSVRAGQLRLIAGLSRSAENGAVQAASVPKLVSLLRLARADRRRTLAENLEAVEERGGDMGDVRDSERLIAAIESLMRTLGTDPHAKPDAGEES